MWIADGFATDTWAPASPLEGKLDAFVWETPAERLSAPDLREPAEEEERSLPPFTPAPTPDAPVPELVEIEIIEPQKAQAEPRHRP